jgi:biotin carboxylase
VTGPDQSPRPGGIAVEDRPLLLLISTGSRKYREYLLRSISSRYRVHLFLGAEPDWELDYVDSWTVMKGMADTISADEMCAAAQQLAGREPVRGVLCWDEARILQSAKVAASLGLPGGDPDMVMRCRDKHQTRLALDAAGTPQPRSMLVADLDSALAAAGQIGYPVVLKPRAMGGSLGVVQADDAGQLTQRFALARDTVVPGSWRYDAGVLIEQCLTGPEISIDAAVFHGEVLPMFLARKQIGYPPFFEELGHMVDAADPLLADDDVLRILRQAHSALGFTDGMTHTELKLTPAGPMIVEVNARLGGGLIPYLGMRASGMDPGLAAAAVACGQRPELIADRQLVGAVRFFYVDSDDTTIGEIRFEPARLPSAADLAIVLAKPGDVKSPPPKGTMSGRIALATAVGRTAVECLQALDAVSATLSVRPASEAAAGLGGTP